MIVAVRTDRETDCSCGKGPVRGGSRADFNRHPPGTFHKTWGPWRPLVDFCLEPLEQPWAQHERRQPATSSIRVRLESPWNMTTETWLTWHVGMTVQDIVQQIRKLGWFHDLSGIEARSGTAQLSMHSRVDLLETIVFKRKSS